MGFVERELEKLARAMEASTSEQEIIALSIAYQALMWSRDPNNVLSPAQATRLQTPPAPARRRLIRVAGNGGGAQSTANGGMEP